MRYILNDYRDIRKRLRECIKFFKHKNNIADKLASGKFLLEIHRELEDHLMARGLLRRRKYRRYEVKN